MRCLVCKILIPEKTEVGPKVKLCSNECRAIRKKMYQRKWRYKLPQPKHICRGCKKIFKGSRIFCTPECNAKFNARRRRIKMLAVRKKFNSRRPLCKCCKGKLVKVWKVGSRKKPKYCSLKCARYGDKVVHARKIEADRIRYHSIESVKHCNCVDCGVSITTRQWKGRRLCFSCVARRGHARSKEVAALQPARKCKSADCSKHFNGHWHKLYCSERCRRREKLKSQVKRMIPGVVNRRIRQMEGLYLKSSESPIPVEITEAFKTTLLIRKEAKEI